MDTERLPFKEGDRVVHHYGIRGEFLQEALVGRVLSNGNFLINRSDVKFRQTGWEAGGKNVWGQEWVEPWSPEGALKVLRHKLEVRVTSAANVLVQSMSDMDTADLENVALYLEQSNRKAKGD